LQLDKQELIYLTFPLWQVKQPVANVELHVKHEASHYYLDKLNTAIYLAHI